MRILQTIDLKKYYGTEPNITRALDGVNFSVNDGEFVAVVGTSGSGKSTLLHMMGGLDTPTSGNVIVRDKELSKMNDEQLTIFRRRNIGFIFQNYNLVPILNVYENIVLPVELDGDTVDQKFLDEIVHLLGLKDKLKNMPNNLSGGQQQRVAIARALITKPAIVLADEPTGNLDSKTSAEVLGLIKRTSAEFRQTVVMITHNDDIARLADRIVRIEDAMELTPTLILNLALLIVPPVTLVLVFWQWLARHIRWVVALTALCDVLLFWDELFYYESFGLFAVLILVQLVATGAAAFRFYYKQRKG